MRRYLIRTQCKLAFALLGLKNAWSRELRLIKPCASSTLPAGISIGLYYPGPIVMQQLGEGVVDVALYNPLSLIGRSGDRPKPVGVILLDAIL